MLTTDIINAIDARVNQSLQNYTAIGTVVERQSLTDAMVVFDGSQGAIPVKVAGTAAAYEGDRVYLTRHDHWWVISGTAPYRGVFQQLAEIVLTVTNTSTVTFSGIPNTYRHLKLLGAMRSNAAAQSTVDVRVRCNGDSTARYSYLTLDIQNSQALSWPQVNTQAGQTGFNWGFVVPGASVYSGTRAGFELTIWDYTEQTQFTTKEMYSMSGFADVGTLQHMRVRWGVWDPTTIQGINSIELAASAGNFEAGSRVGLWGIT